jgi:hypothetical protein
MFILAKLSVPNETVRGVVNGAPIGEAIMCGTYAEVARYQLLNGLRAFTKIIAL